MRFRVSAPYGVDFAGVTDICLMATLLGKLPWNGNTAKQEDARDYRGLTASPTSRYSSGMPLFDPQIDRR